MFKKITASIAGCVVLCAGNVLAMNDEYPSALITTANSSAHNVSVHFTAGKSVLAYYVSSGFYKTQASGRIDGTNNIQHTYKLSNDTLKIKVAMNNLQELKKESKKISLPTDPEYTIQEIIAGSTVIYKKQLVSLGGLISTPDGGLIGHPRNIPRCSLIVTVPCNDTK